MNWKVNILFIVFLVLVFMSMSLDLLAQVPPPPDPAAIPLDPLSWVLLAAGGGLATKKYYDMKNNTGD